MKPKLRSKNLSPDVPQYYMRRVFLKCLGATDEDLEKPLVAIANTWNEILPGSMHLDRIAAAVKRGINDAGGFATIFNVLAPCDGQGSGNEGFKYILPSRDLIQDCAGSSHGGCPVQSSHRLGYRRIYASRSLQRR